MDGFIHQIKAAVTDRGFRVFTTACGAEVPQIRPFEVVIGATGWSSKVTCPDPRCNWYVRTGTPHETCNPAPAKRKRKT
jgi:hypothetical protein